MRPTYAFELLRSTNAPLEVVAERLARGSEFHRWHPRLSSVDLRVEVDTPEGFRAAYSRRMGLGLSEEGRFEVTRQDGHLRLWHGLRFRGWPVLLLMGWWRIRSRRIWESFVAALPPPGGNK
jgi:hypothetical protein